MDTKNMRRALRRHHRARLIAKRTRAENPYWGRRWVPGCAFTPADAGQISRTPKNCDCWMCRNPRGVFKDLLLRERSDLEAIKREVV